MTKVNYQKFYNVYINEDNSLNQTAERLGIAQVTARRFAQRHGLFWLKAVKKLNVKEIKRLHYYKNLSALNIATMKKCDYNSVKRWMIENGLKLREKRAAYEPKRVKRPIKPYFSMQSVLYQARRDYQKDGILMIDGEKYQILAVYPYHLLMGKYEGKKLVYRESYRLTELYFMKLRERKAA